MITYIYSFIKDHWHTKIWLIVLILNFLLIYIEYKFDFEDQFIESITNSYLQIFVYHIYYGLPIIIVLFISTYFRKNLHLFKQIKFIILVLVSIICLSIYDAISFHRSYIIQLFDYPFNIYFLKCSDFITRPLFIVSIVFIYWKFIHSSTNFYGFSSKNINWKMYLIISLILFPIIYFVGFTKDFNTYYPRYKYYHLDEFYNLPEYLFLSIYELCYAINFIFIEFFFRGFLILAFKPYIKKDALLLMITVYAMIHFSKPLGETISSIFGGYFLGILVYETCSIYGGVLLHWIVAFGMEASTYYQKFIKLND